MPSITHFHRILKRDFFKQFTFLKMFFSTDPTAYCQARQRLSLELFKTSFQKIGQNLRAKIGNDYLWHGHRLWVVDGSSCSMPDTPELQEVFGQPDG